MARRPRVIRLTRPDGHRVIRPEWPERSGPTAQSHGLPQQAPSGPIGNEAVGQLASCSHSIRCLRPLAQTPMFRRRRRMEWTTRRRHGGILVKPPCGPAIGFDGIATAIFRTRSFPIGPPGQSWPLQPFPAPADATAPGQRARRKIDGPQAISFPAPQLWGCGPGGHLRRLRLTGRKDRTPKQAGEQRESRSERGEDGNHRKRTALTPSERSERENHQQPVRWRNDPGCGYVENAWEKRDTPSTGGGPKRFVASATIPPTRGESGFRVGVAEATLR